MSKIILVMLSLVGLIVTGCSSAYNVVSTTPEHNFGELDGPKAIQSIVPIMIKMADVNNTKEGAHFMSMVSSSHEKKYFSDFYQRFEEDYSLKNLSQTNGKFSLIYKNNLCVEDVEDCVESLLVVYGPPANPIISCKNEKTHKETKEVSVNYHYMGFPFYILYQLKGSEKLETFNTLLYITTKDFDQYNQIMGQIKSIYQKFPVKCDR